MPLESLSTIIYNIVDNLIIFLGYYRWTAMEENDQRKFLFLVIEKCEAVDPEVRLTAARVLLYLVQGKMSWILLHDIVF